MKILLSLSKPVGWYSKDEMKRISSRVPKSNVELGLYKIQLRTSGIDVVIDNFRGYGSDLKTKTLFDAGCLVHMAIPDFLALCKPNPADAKGAEQLARDIEEGTSIGNPSILFSVKERTVKAHDGQKRAMALMRLGFKHIPVLMFFSDYKSRQIPDWNKFEQFLNRGIKSADRGKIVKDFVLKLTYV